MKKIAVILGMLSLVLAITSLLLWNRLRTRDLILSGLRAEAAAPKACPSMEIASLRQPACAAAVIDPAETASASPPQPDLDLFGRVHRDPRFQAEMVDYLRIDFRQQYAAFLSTLGLTREKEDQLMLILAQQRVRGSSGIPKEYTREEWQKENDVELRAVLSQPQIDAFRRYRETDGTREQVKSLRDELLATRDPLRDDQIEPLVDALHPEEMQLMEEIRVFKEGLDQSADALPGSERKAEAYFAEREEAAAERKLTAAAAILSGDQLKALRRRIEAQEAMSRQGSKLRRLQFELAESMGRPDVAADSAN